MYFKTRLDMDIIIKLVISYTNISYNIFRKRYITRKKKVCKSFINKQFYNGFYNKGLTDLSFEYLL